MAIAKGSSKLRFNFKTLQIVSTIGSPISTKDLLLNLQKLFNELSSLDQDKLDLNKLQLSLDSLKDDLASKKLIKHSSSGIQSFVSCCLADILRLYAPDAPFNASQLSDIFKLFINQLKKLNDLDDPYYHQNVYLLNRLSESRSIVLITDLPNSQQLIDSIFEAFYQLCNKTDINSKLQPQIVDILSEIISESNTISNASLKLILNKFLSNSRTLHNNSSSTPGFEFTLELCNNNVDRMSRLLTQFFSEIVYEGTNTKQEDNYHKSHDDHRASDHTLAKLKKIHLLSVELWRYVPEMMSSVMGLIDNELEADDERIRVTATETIGKILSIKSSRLNFSKTHSETYINWIKKPLDRSPNVRSSWVKCIKLITSMNTNNTGVIGDLTTGIMKTLVDSDERVRLITVNELLSMDPSLFLGNLANPTIMSTLSQLVREKHPEIRNASLNLLGSLFNASFDKLFKGDELIDKLVSWIPDDIFKLIYINDKSINAQVDIILFEKILPFETIAEKRVYRPLIIFDKLSEKAKSSFMAIVKRQQQLSGVVNQLLKFAESYNGGVIMDDTEDGDKLLAKIEKVIAWLSTSIPPEFSPRQCLLQFIKLNNKRYFRLLKLCLSTSSDYETISNCIDELFTKLSESKNIKIEGESNSVSAIEMKSCMKLLIYRSSLLWYNQSNIKDILNFGQSNSSLKETAHVILDSISNVVPVVLKTNISTLVDNSIFNKSTSSTEIHNKEQDLKTIYHFIKKFPDFEIYSTSATFTSSTSEAEKREMYNTEMIELALNGTPIESRYTMKILSVDELNTEPIEKIVDQVWPLDDVNEDLINTRLSCIAELFNFHFDLIEPKSKEISPYLASKILLANKTVGASTAAATQSDDEDKTNEVEWIADDELNSIANRDCYSKLIALRIFINWLKSLESSPSAAKTAEPIFKLLNSILGNGGEIVSQKSATYPTPANYQSRLRLHAGLQILKLAKIPSYNSLINQECINRLIFLIQDENEIIRMKFMNQLKKNLTLGLISERFLSLVFFIAHEPALILKEDTKTWIRSSFKRQLVTTTITKGKNVANVGKSEHLLFERSFVRLLHMISHHQEFNELYSLSNPLPGVKFALTYITFALDLIGNSENISLLYYLTTKMKIYKDKLLVESNGDSGNSNKLYMLSDLTQMTIKSLTNSKNWNLITWPGNLSLSNDLFVKLTNKEEIKEVSQTLFINDGALKKVDELIKEKIRGLCGSGEKKKVVTVGAANGGNSAKTDDAVGVVAGNNNNNNNKKKKKNSKKRVMELESEDDEIVKVEKQPTRVSNRKKQRVNYSYDEGEEDESEDEEDHLDDSVSVE